MVVTSGCTVAGGAVGLSVGGSKRVALGVTSGSAIGMD